MSERYKSRFLESSQVGNVASLTSCNELDFVTILGGMNYKETIVNN